MKCPKLGGGMGILAVLGLAVLPKCPLCVTLGLGVLGMSLAAPTWLLALLTLVLLGTVTTAARGTLSRRLAGSAVLALLLLIAVAVRTVPSPVAGVVDPADEFCGPARLAARSTGGGI